MSKEYNPYKNFLKCYYDAIEDAYKIHDYTKLKQLQIVHPDWVKEISKSQRAKKRLTELTAYLTLINDSPIYWVTLTYKASKDKNKEKNKREEAIKHFKSVSDYYIFVEEYGEDYGRYHIHAFVVLRANKTYQDLTAWHSRNKTLKLDYQSVAKKIKYLTKYLVKQAPRIHCSRLLARGLLLAKKKYPKARLSCDLPF